MTKINTEEYRLALGGSSNDDILNFNWVDKPHRLIYDLASECDANQQEIAELKSLAAYAEQRANIAEKASDNSALRVASLNSQAVNQVKMFNEKVDEIAELKRQVELFKAIHVRLTNSFEFANSGDGRYFADNKLMLDFHDVVIMREGKS